MFEASQNHLIDSQGPPRYSREQLSRPLGVLNKIVIAEDDDAIAHMVNMALGDAGFLCMRARDGDEAINLVRHHAPDLMVLDVMMPRTDGLEVVRRLRADVQTSRTPVGAW